MVGDPVENFILKDQDGKDFSLYDNLNQKVLLVFYPKDNTSVCNLQLTNYDLSYESFKKDNIQLVCINIADVSEHKSYCVQKGFKFPLLSDVDKIVSAQFNALNLLGQNKRKVVLIGADKTILYEKTVLSFLYLNSAQIIKLLKERKIE
jgi:thioredoxin-dependent peroxiredoxin